MIRSRRTLVLAAAAGGLAGVAAHGVAWAQTYPERPITIVVAYPRAGIPTQWHACTARSSRSACGRR